MKLLFVLLAFCLLVPACHADGLLQNGDTTHPITFFAASPSNGQSGVTGLAGSITLTISKNGAAATASAGTLAEVDSVNQPGVYKYTPTATEVNTDGELVLYPASASAYINIERRRIVAVNPDSLTQFMSVDFPTLSAPLRSLLRGAYLSVSGATTPSTNDTWGAYGLNGGVVVYANSAATLFDWYNGTNWTISSAVGTPGAAYFTGGTFVTSAYTPGGTATGTPVVVAHGNAVLNTFQPDVTLPTDTSVQADTLAAAVTTIPAAGTTTGVAETLTQAQSQALMLSLIAGASTNTAPAASSTATVTYYLLGRPKTTGTVVAVSSPTFDASTNLSGRTVLIQQPFPAL